VRAAAGVSAGFHTGLQIQLQLNDYDLVVINSIFLKESVPLILMVCVWVRVSARGHLHCDGGVEPALYGLRFRRHAELKQTNGRSIWWACNLHAHLA
jgi:hypothetical protein